MRIVLVLLLSLCGIRAPAQSRNSVNFAPERHLRKGVDAWPLIVRASTPAEQKVNAILNQLNERMAKSLIDCDANYRNWAKLVDNPLTGSNGVDGDWERKIAVTMTGPRLVSLVAFDNLFCGGAHPDSYTLPMVFDLTTGTQVNWINYIDKSADASTYSDTESDGAIVDALIVPALREMTIRRASGDCEHAFQKAQPYQLWPDAKSGTLVAEPFDLPHVVAACADALRLTLDQARKLGFDDRVLKAIAQAHENFDRMHR